MCLFTVALNKVIFFQTVMNAGIEAAYIVILICFRPLKDLKSLILNIILEILCLVAFICAILLSWYDKISKFNNID